MVLLGGDLLPHHYLNKNFIFDFLQPNLQSLKTKLEIHYPKIFLILGNDDARIEEPLILELENKLLIEYIHFRKFNFLEHDIYGYAFTPPSPFLLKDWEKYDVSRYVDIGAVSPEEGIRTVDIDKDKIQHSTISDDLKELSENSPVKKTIFLFHSPPYNSLLDRAGLDNKKVDHAPIDVHVGSIAIQKFIKKRQPLLTLHGHVHETVRLTGKWREKTGKTFSFSAAHEGPELAVIRFDMDDLDNASRELITTF